MSCNLNTDEAARIDGLQNMFLNMAPQDASDNTSEELEVVKKMLASEIPAIIANVERSLLASEDISKSIKKMNLELAQTVKAKNELAETLEMIHSQNKKINVEISQMRTEMGGLFEYQSRILTKLGEPSLNLTELSALNVKSSGRNTVILNNFFFICLSKLCSDKILGNLTLDIYYAFFFSYSRFIWNTYGAYHFGIRFHGAGIRCDGATFYSLLFDEEVGKKNQDG